ncbi:MAG: UDP-N-acetylmuramoyl-L-alanine--D-glutamate ligase [Gammaproteobacteria bacterium]|nr:UDP-N-acetylmuramoyl-L-alanine--D-glutamate ligase [Gammaproteobacteria bacterium]
MDDLHVIVGLGITGLSCANYLAKQGVSIAVTDSRQTPPNLNEFKQKYPHIPLSIGGLNETLLDQAAKLIVSPGVSLQQPSIARQIKRGVPLVGDIELFAQEVKAPVIAITGTNAKSTVTTLVGLMAEKAGINVRVGGNLGIPALDLLSQSAELFVLELSSFQLETTYSLTPAVATVLNVTPDHLDRYATLENYCKTKHIIYKNCQIAVCNRDDELTHCSNHSPKKRIQFTLNEPYENEFGLLKKNNELYLAHENELLIPVHELPILGSHYHANALAALAIGYGFGLSMDSMLQALVEFKGLPHRCQLVRNRNGVVWYNDSKGTNVGATLAAILGLGSQLQGKLVLIAGGIGKNADFSPLIPAIERYVKTVVLIGEAAQTLATVIGDASEVLFAESMEQAIQISDAVSAEGDSVLLSPACASFDMFNNFEHRGDVFTHMVNSL